MLFTREKERLTLAFKRSSLLELLKARVTVSTFVLKAVCITSSAT